RRLREELGGDHDIAEERLRQRRKGTDDGESGQARGTLGDLGAAHRGTFYCVRSYGQVVREEGVLHLRGCTAGCERDDLRQSPLLFGIRRGAKSFRTCALDSADGVGAQDARRTGRSISGDGGHRRTGGTLIAIWGVAAPAGVLNSIDIYSP